MENIIIDVIYDDTQIYHVLEPNLSGVTGVPMSQRMVRDSIANIKVLLGHLLLTKVYEFEAQILADNRVVANIANPNQLFLGYPDTFVFDGEPYVNYPSRTDLHYAQGWRRVVLPEAGATQTLEDDYVLVGEIITRPLRELTLEDYKARAIAQYEKNNEIASEKLYKKIVVEKAQTFDDTKALENSAVFPMWKEGITVKVAEKFNGFDGTEIKLYKVVQAHTTQSGWNPSAVPALFTRVAYPNQILDWVQPTGAQDAYQIGAKVKHLGFTWTSTANNNTWAPGVYGWTKQ
jgi:hypothetical protein